MQRLGADILSFTRDEIESLLAEEFNADWRRTFAHEYKLKSETEKFVQWKLRRLFPSEEQQ